MHFSFKVKTDDFFIDFLKRGNIIIEAHASCGSDHATFARSMISLSSLLEKHSISTEIIEIPNPTIDNMCSLVSVTSSTVQMGLLRYKLRMRNPLGEALKWL